MNLRNTAGFLAAALWCCNIALAEHGGPPTPGQPLIIDVRTAAEYQQAHIRQAINVPFDQINGRIAALTADRDAHIVLYCRSGRRSGIAEQTLRQLGYRQVENRGGLHDMQRSGYQTD
mgnify:CR=1 FL=1